ncbi:hypothetical protein [Xenorhabdus hominickii]|uniref:Uncharacterized protein n=1 Tax=Xenorhabdus hominickii TaxID=351679 RepID=A0A2G0Q399_XENHO|nr:hypothetical protein [Xenorhabdus hominickii]AOM39892.1 hypothetical protein A9255_04475 [Xenorhabdus hominickii]PHM53681.1 hypothetical protein Xhom_03682 [Xenorhabdus hominickii]
MRDDDTKTWHDQWALKREQINRVKGRGEEDVRDQWISERIKSYDKDVPKNALTKLSAIYKNRATIINHNCLDEFDTIHKPRPGRHKPPFQQPHESLDNIYMLERSWPESDRHKQRQPRLNVFKQCCWPRARYDDDCYYYVMKRIDSMEICVPDGHYIYVIYSDMPQIVVCSICDFSKPLVTGHTSLIKGRLLWYRHDASQPLPNDDDIDHTKYPVLLAGELFFTHGILTQWNNRSGHYRPRSSPVLEFGATDHILPRKLFKDVFQ